MDVDLKQIAERLTKAAERSSKYAVTASSTDLIISKDGRGTGRSEAVPFAALFLRHDDVFGQALDRLEKGSAGEPVKSEAAGS